MIAKAQFVSGNWLVRLGRRFHPLPFSTFSDAQAFADLCNHKPPPKHVLTQSTITHNNHTYTPTQWQAYLNGKLS